MLFRRFGRTELEIPVFSCGGMRYQYKWQDVSPTEIPAANQQNLEATIKTALEFGINHIETARFYGTSEMQLGQILPTLPREKLIVQTKLAPKSDLAEFRQDFAKSMNYLGLDYLDLFSIHGINNRETFDNAMLCLEEAKKLQSEGRVRFIGFSTHGPTDIILEAIETNQFDYVNLHWYWINQTNWPAIEAASKLDMGIFIISPSDKGGKLYAPSPKLVELCRPLSPIVFNNLFCLSHPQVHTLSIGAARPEDFAEHLKTLDLLSNAAEILKPIEQRLEAEALKILGEEWLNTWHMGLPKWEDTPDEINTNTILWLRNLALAYDMIEYGKMRYNLLGNGDHWFPGNKASNIKKVDLSEALKNSPHRQIIPSLLLEADELFKGEEVKRLSQN
jgi:uncharacterized protein